MTTTTVVVEMETLGGQGATAYADDVDSAERAGPPLTLTRDRDLDSRMVVDSEMRRRTTGVVGGGGAGDREEERLTDVAEDGVANGDEGSDLPAPVGRSGDGWFARILGYGKTAEEKRAYDAEHGYDRLRYDQVDNHPPGIPRLAFFQNSDDSFAVYRRFGWLSARLLVQLEIELTELEQRLLDLDAEDGRDSVLRHRLWLREGFEGWNADQRVITDNIRVKMGEYFELLLKDSQVRALGRATQRHYLGLFNFVFTEKPLPEEKMGFVFQAEDFVSTSRQSEKGNRLGDYIEAYIDRWPQSPFKRFLQTERELKKSTENIDHFKDKRIEIVVNTIAVCLAVALLLTPVLLLFLVSMSRGAMAATVVGFVLAFAVIMSVVTDAKAEQILIGTAAYAAVLVTFLGNLGGIKNGRA